MSIGPVQLIMLGFERPDFRGETVAAMIRLCDNDAVHVIDALAVYRDGDAEFEVAEVDGRPGAEAAELGLLVAALVGLNIEGEEGTHRSPGVDGSNGQEGWDVLDDIPRDTVAALLLIEHHWAIPLRDAFARAGGYRIGDGFISPLDLVEIRLVSAQEAMTLHAIENGVT